ncbi:MAG: sporulation protein [Clostridiales bacterium]|nr:sporulation protein [Clostridiales bacterium]
MVMIKRVLALLGSGALAILLLRQAETAAQAVRDGVQLCLTSVIPALFPFFAVSSLLVALGAAEAAGRVLARPFRRLFRCGGAGCAALLLGLVGGYPVGARTAAELVRRGELSPAEGARLLTGLLFCRRPLPVTAMPKRPVPPQTGLTGQFLRAVEGAVSAMARVCGFVVFFLVLLRLAEGLIGPLPPLAAGVLELTNGILRLTPDRRGFVTAAALLGWGGLSVHCQTAAVTAGSGISLRLYLPAKAVQAALSAGLAALLAPYLPA